MFTYRFSVCAEYLAGHGRWLAAQSPEWWANLRYLSQHADRGLVNALSFNCPTSEAVVLDRLSDRPRHTF